MEKEDLGFFSSWSDVFSKARELFDQGKVESVATVSLDEYKRGQYVASPLRGMGFSEEESLENLSQLAPMLYQGNEQFHLSLRKTPCFHPDYPEGEIWMLVIVYLKAGETIER